MVKTEVNPLENSEYSFLFFYLAEKEMYASEIASQLNDSQPTIQRRLKRMVRTKLLLVKKHPQKKKNIKLFSVNWEKIIEELLKKIREKLKMVLKEIEENNLDFNRIFKNFKEIISRAEDKNFEEKIKRNKYLIKFLQAYFKYIVRLNSRETTISEAFSILFYFENFNFIEEFETSSSFYNLKKIQQAIAIHLASSKLQSEIAKNSSKQDFPKMGEEFLKLKKGFEKENLKKDSDLEDLFLLGEIFKVVKLKPSLRIGLGEGVASVGKELVKNNFTNEEIKQYFDSFYFGFLDFDYEEQIRKELSELIGEEIPQKHFLVKGNIMDKETYEEFKRMYPNEPED